jgi:hypothetical protein
MSNASKAERRQLYGLAQGGTGIVKRIPDVGFTGNLDRDPTRDIPAAPPPTPSATMNNRPVFSKLSESGGSK